MDNGDYIRVLLYSYYTTIAGWGVLLSYSLNSFQGGYVGDDIVEYCRAYEGAY